MKNNLVFTIAFIAISLTSFSQHEYRFDPGYRIPDGTIHYYKFAILPASSSSSGEILTIEFFGGYFTSDRKFIQKLFFANREGFIGVITEKNGTAGDYVQIEAFEESDGSVSIYLVLKNFYCHGMVVASASGIKSDNVLQVNPIKQTSVTGTKIFDSKTEIPGITTLTDGNVGIGTTTPTYKLAVNGTIGAKEVIVTNDIWPDFVFAAGYQLKTLKEVECFIKENQHLPDVPSAKEIAEKGISLGEMNALLLQKIEELTLYVIVQQREIEALKVEKSELESESQASKNMEIRIQKLEETINQINK